MPIFEYEFTVDAPVHEVDEFHRDVRALKLLTPAPLSIKRADPPADGAGAEFVVWLPLPMRWVARYEDVGPDGFSDVQTEGPLASWRHRHSWEAIDAKTTRVREYIEYEYASGLAGLLGRIFMSAPGLLGLFTYRKWRTRRALER